MTTSPTNIVVIGASAGGVVALQRLLSQFGPEWPIAVFITLHSGKNRNRMPDLLNRVSSLRASFAQHNAPFGRGIYVAPPDRHLIIDSATTVLSAGPKENHTRPAIDPMFRSAAKHHASRVIGVLLTGYLYDGMNGLYDIHRRGGTTIVQDPLDAEVPEIPKNALRRLQPDYVLPLDDISKAISQELKLKRGVLRRGAEA